MGVKAVTIFIDENLEIEAIRTRPAGAESSEEAEPQEGAEGTSQATANATYDPQTGRTDVNADVTYDF